MHLSLLMARPSNCSRRRKKSTLTPTWKETFEVALPKGPPDTKWQLTIDMEDWDRVSAADFMGRVVVELELARRPGHCEGLVSTYG